MRRDAGAALDKHAGAERLQLGGDLRNEGDAGLVGSGLRRTPMTTGMRIYLSQTLNYGIRVDYL